jgi:hypothetical protein
LLSSVANPILCTSERLHHGYKSVYCVLVHSLWCDVLKTANSRCRCFELQSMDYLSRAIHYLRIRKIITDTQSRNLLLHLLQITYYHLVYRWGLNPLIRHICNPTPKINAEHFPNNVEKNNPWGGGVHSLHFVLFNPLTNNTKHNPHSTAKITVFQKTVITKHANCICPTTKTKNCIGTCICTFDPLKLCCY